tara:strand:- start:171 stop:719 length:549 start_codon:yes stop_codon:yes gene_type:complete
MSFEILEQYPHRSPLDIGKSFGNIIKDKIVCDVGCGAGDLLECLRINGLCKDVKGIECDRRRYCPEREYITLGNAYDGIPDADVYIVWVGDIDYENILRHIKHDAIIFYLDGSEENQTKFSTYKGISFMNRTEYTYDETPYIKPEHMTDYLTHLKEMQKINPNWTLAGKRFYCTYKWSPPPI